MYIYLKFCKFTLLGHIVIPFLNHIFLIWDLHNFLTEKTKWTVVPYFFLFYNLSEDSTCMKTVVGLFIACISLMSGFEVFHVYKSHRTATFSLSCDLVFWRVFIKTKNDHIKLINRLLFFFIVAVDIFK